MKISSSYLLPFLLFGVPALWGCSHTSPVGRNLSSAANVPRSFSPDVDWGTSACQDFLQYSLHQIDAPQGVSFNTDAMVVLKDGKNLLEFYDGDPAFGGDANKGLFFQNSVHSLWSASKTITGTLIARALKEGATIPLGDRLTLNTKLDKIFPAKTIFGFYPTPILPGTPRSELAKLPHLGDGNTYAGHYFQITLENLIYMGSGFEWNESYEAGLAESTFLPMLYLRSGNPDMFNYAIHQPIGIEGPGKRYTYSGGNSVILSTILREAYGAQAYAHLPWDLLFDPLDMKGPVFERDGRGIFIGNSYAYLRPLDMASFGQLYLQGGVWRGKQLLDPQWVKDAQRLSPPETLPDTPLSYIVEEGVYSARTFWLNQKVQSHCAEFPHSPSDMYFAAGHYGQLMMVLPKQNMVIARTGHDSEYWSKIDGFVSKAVACIAPERPSKTPLDLEPNCQEGK